MDRFEEMMQDLMDLSDEGRQEVIEEMKSMCICSECPSYNECAKNSQESIFCAKGRSFMCITAVNECICEKCPVYKEMGLNNTLFCTRGSERAQRYEHSLR
jgi:hypothetical protein